MEGSIEPGRKRQNDGQLLAHRKVLQVPVILLKGELMSPSEGKLQCH